MELTFSTFDDKPLPIEGLYKGSSCFLVLSGPSLNSLDLSLLNQPNIITFGINNSPKIYRPRLWTCVDDPEKFMISIFKDPLITKFIPVKKQNKKLFDNTKWKMTNDIVKDCPGVIYYHRNERFNHETFLTEPTINWGSHKDYGGRRSVLHAAIKICYLLGFSRIFLLGCDFNMKLGVQNYAWKQDRTSGSVKGNNNTYAAMQERFTLLRPLFEEKNFFVYNCNPNSGLTAFPYVSYKNAINLAVNAFYDTKNERAEGMYERKDEPKSYD